MNVRRDPLAAAAAATCQGVAQPSLLGLSSCIWAQAAVQCKQRVSQAPESLSEALRFFFFFLSSFPIGQEQRASRGRPACTSPALTRLSSSSCRSSADLCAQQHWQLEVYSIIGVLRRSGASKRMESRYYKFHSLQGFCSWSHCLVYGWLRRLCTVPVRAAPA